MTEATPSPVARVAQIASKLAAIDPTTTEIVRELFRVFSEVQDHFRRPEPTDTAPREAGASIFLFCSDQHGWQVGTWSPEGLPRWVATIDAATVLHPSHWMRPAAPPEDVQPDDRQAA